ncbi:MAG: hypothetical protein U0232_00915 [Thermomicrobiales bacterium]
MAGAERARRDWAGVMQEQVLGLQDWRARHPAATFADRGRGGPPVERGAGAVARRAGAGPDGG